MSFNWHSTLLNLLSTWAAAREAHVNAGEAVTEAALAEASKALFDHVSPQQPTMPPAPTSTSAPSPTA